MVKLCVFDLDGTLVYTLADLTASLNYALNECGFPPLNEAEVSAIVGHSTKYMSEHAVPPEHIDQADRVLDIYQKHYSLHYMDRSYPYDGMVDAVLAIKRAGVRVAVVSNKPHADTVKVIDALYPKDTFSLVLGRTEKFAIKPAPDSLNFVMDFFDIKPEEAVYVGDSDVDVAFARNAKMRCVAVKWGYRTVSELLAAGADCITDDPKELAELVLRGRTEEKTC